MCKFFLQKTDKRITYQELKKMNIGWLSAKVAERTVKINFKICCLYIILVLPGSVETQLAWSGKFC